MSIVVAAWTNSGEHQLFKSIGRWIADLIKVTADCYTAAAMYEQLSRLSDAELQRRALSRAGLARSVLRACNRPVAE